MADEITDHTVGKDGILPKAVEGINAAADKIGEPLIGGLLGLGVGLAGGTAVALLIATGGWVPVAVALSLGAAGAGSGAKGLPWLTNKLAGIKLGSRLGSGGGSTSQGRPVSQALGLPQRKE